jgi:hypothetical protein
LEPTLYSIIKSTGNGEIGHLDKLEFVRVLGESFLDLVGRREPPHSTPDRVSRLEESFNRAGGNVAVGAGDKNKPFVCHDESNSMSEV